MSFQSEEDARDLAALKSYFIGLYQKANQTNGLTGSPQEKDFIAKINASASMSEVTGLASNLYNDTLKSLWNIPSVGQDGSTLPAPSDTYTDIWNRVTTKKESLASTELDANDSNDNGKVTDYVKAGTYAAAAAANAAHSTIGAPPDIATSSLAPGAPSSGTAVTTSKTEPSGGYNTSPPSVSFGSIGALVDANAEWHHATLTKSGRDNLINWFYEKSRSEDASTISNEIQNSDFSKYYAGSGTPPPPNNNGITTPTQSTNSPDFVKKAYRSFLGRDPSSNELNAGIKEKPMDLMVNLSTSQPGHEFADKMLGTGGSTDTNYDEAVTKLFKDYIGSAPDNDQMRTYAAAMKSGMSMPDLREMMLQANPGAQVSQDQQNAEDGAITTAIQKDPNNYGPAVFVKDVIKYYGGGEASADDLQKYGSELVNDKMSKNEVLRQIIADKNPKATGYNGKYDDVVIHVFKDMAGVTLDPNNPLDRQTINTHGLALQNGMSMQEFRDTMATAQVTLDNLNINHITTPQLDREDELMKTAKDAAVGMISGSGSSDTSTASNGAAAAAGAATAGTPAPTPDQVGVIDTAADRDIKAKMDVIWTQYTGNPATDDDFRIHGQLLLTGAKSMDQMKSEVANSSWAQDYRTKVINDTFNSIVKRPPDSNDMAIWQDRLKGGGDTVQSFQALAQQNAPTDIHNYINTLYEQKLGRPADDAADNVYTNAIKNGSMTRDQASDSINKSDEAYVVRTLGDYFGKDKVTREDVQKYAGELSSANREQVLINITQDQKAVALQDQYSAAGGDAVDKATVDRLFASNNIAGGASSVDEKIHGAALKAGMSPNDLNDYLHNAAIGGVVAFTDQK